ncbi:sugar lactone lactonase YvrE [Advenella incenata]|uniref:Sugar lactone lactonase YvrE n=1 Tax=Advenella incenata TaxID=267800 RepID=A0A4Q7VFE3_9BURK|nr:SMP-30/gluconolactonase/LRE family protein [Advenella incenata]RZT94178.1 sugar lactone lactonase YvrE [Advenella incenata]
MTIDIEPLGSVRAALGECPIWDMENQRLWFMDCRAGLIHQIDPATGRTVATSEVPAPAGSFALNADGRLVVALKEAIALYDPATEVWQTIAQIEDSHPNLRLNDGEALADGSFIVGTMHVLRNEGEPPLGGLYRLYPHGGFIKLASNIGITNGPCVSPVDGRFYVSDSSVRTIYSYAIAGDGTLADRRLFVNTQVYVSGPDGCCFDSAGGLWTALVHAGAIARFGPDGALTNKIELPLTHPASLCFGGENLDELFVTSIRDSGRLRGDKPLDGAVLRVRGMGAQGRAPARTRIGLA